ncbi:MAG TPA: LodA/GoxA family CTQ-dependent oxidase, partial [Polyangium sp.]|nr:LodA/GoxA family CTQ-dependent oxidase [Polyangium sp.]
SCEVWVRFSSDVKPGVGGTLGIALKLFVPDRGKHRTIDIILQNHDVFFVDTAKDMYEFTFASLTGRGEEYLAEHPETARILEEMKRSVPSALDTPYWSLLPFRLGGDDLKLKIVPEGAPPGDGAPRYDDPSYLRADLHARLKKGPAKLGLYVQRRGDPERMPLDKATMRWSEEESRPVRVATITLPQQDTESRGQATYGENLSFNIWRAADVLEPLGSIAAARKVVYEASARNRLDVNGVPIGEPEEPRRTSWYGGAYPETEDKRIVRAAIHPAIGVSRVGNSEQGWFLGPEVVAAPPAKPNERRDARGALKRQAARFRIYGYNAKGEIVREITARDADIRWTVHVANHKASWYRWKIALDTPEAQGLELPRRNADVKGAARAGLEIDPGPRTIRGLEQAGSAYEMRGKFLGNDVYLGEICTDTAGRLVFLPGRGVAASPENKPIYDPKDEDTFINADGWYDDICDGPVTAEVTIDGHSVPVDPAWVLSAPPDYAPSLLGVRTLYDLLYDLHVRAGQLPPPGKPSFQRDIYPILRRMSGLQWVNRGFAAEFGHGGRNPFEDPAFVARLARDLGKDGFDLHRELRQLLLTTFRNPEPRDANQLPWPWIYGDAMESKNGTSPRQNATLSPTQYEALQRWAKGEFIPDYDAAAREPSRLEEVPLTEQPAMLDRAALDHCLADAFHPGCEVTWPLRHLTMFAKPFRIKHHPRHETERDYGKLLDQAIALSVFGPLHAQGPGGLTRWMGLPWHVDTVGCRSGYDQSYNPSIPTFWPARVPNHVLTKESYEAMMRTPDPTKRLEAFNERTDWYEPLPGKAANPEQMSAMVRLFGSMGLLEEQEGVPGDPAFPSKMLVASYGPELEAKLQEGVVAADSSADTSSKLGASAHGAPGRRLWNFASQEEADSAPLPVRIPRK